MEYTDKALEAACAAFWGDQWKKYTPLMKKSRRPYVKRMLDAFFENIKKDFEPGPESVEVGDGKYKVISDEKGLRALRYGEPWRDLVGDNLVGAMLYRIRELENKYGE